LPLLAAGRAVGYGDNSDVWIVGDGAMKQSSRKRLKLGWEHNSEGELRHAGGAADIGKSLVCRNMGCHARKNISNQDLSLSSFVCFDKKQSSSKQNQSRYVRTYYDINIIASEINDQAASVSLLNLALTDRHTRRLSLSLVGRNPCRSNGASEQ